MNLAATLYILVFYFHPVELFGEGVHSLSGFFIGSQGLSLPSYMERITINDITIYYHDSTKNSMAPCPKWLNSTTGQQHWEDIRDISHLNKQTMTTALESAIQQFNLTGSYSDINVYQGYSRCDLYPNGTLKAFLTHAFNGKDFLSLDIDSKTYIASVPQAEKYKRQRERNPGLIGITAAFYKKTCFDRLKLFLTHASGVNVTKAPEVRIVEKQTMGFNILSCHVTGFYPRAVQVTWTGTDLQLVDNEMNDVVPNGDGTYQTRRSVIRPEEDTGNQHYSCVVHHSSLREGNITVIWDKEQKQISLAVYITLCFVVMATVLGLVIRCIFKRKDTGI
ncbi:major histocompatibility complex class I-related gene protein-like isoform 2-T2 [Clarias gariepinus]|uniref:major histocompatibility complex class I-related gene protein-like n=1 Tax=Clarias gariepinus TaxID=13013 RepID=UPI00234D443A|nr:major histocompatibility complex class I-related gene protein-like [Clarias gariepinus]